MVREGEKVKERLRELVGEEGVKVAVVVDEHLGGGWGAWEEVKGWVEFGGLVEGDVECNGLFLFPPIVLLFFAFITFSLLTSPF